MATTTTYYVFGLVTSGLFIPMVVSIVGVTWLVGIAIKAMKSKDLV